MNADKTTLEQVRAALELRNQIAERLRYNAAEGYAPYGWQETYHGERDRDGTACRQVMLLAANQVGKSLCGAMDDSFHLTGRYPPWWRTGWPRHRGPIKMVVGGQTATALRDTLMSKLLGNMVGSDSWGTGAVPKECLPPREAVQRWPGIPDAVASVPVRHETDGRPDGESLLFFKSYDQDPRAWMGTGIDRNHLDEEPPQSHYSQALRSTIATNGVTKITMTPENGMTEVVQAFMQAKQPGQLLVQATWNEALHLDAQTKAQLLVAFPEHERDMRTRGVPMLGSGRVFPVEESVLRVEAFAIPEHWHRIAGMDFGNNHGQAVVWLAVDPSALAPDKRVVYVYDCYKRVNPSHADHAEAIKGRGAMIPVAWPHDGMRRDGYAGEGLAVIYRNLGVNMRREHFRNPPPDNTNAREPGIQAILLAMQAARFFVFSHLEDWFKEFRMYHRKDGEVVPVNDDLMSATRYAFMSRRHAMMPRRKSEDDGPVPGTLDYSPFSRREAF